MSYFSIGNYFDNLKNSKNFKGGQIENAVEQLSDLYNNRSTRTRSTEWKIERVNEILGGMGSPEARAELEKLVLTAFSCSLESGSLSRERRTTDYGARVENKGRTIMSEFVRERSQYLEERVGPGSYSFPIRYARRTAALLGISTLIAGSSCETPGLNSIREEPLSRTEYIMPEESAPSRELVSFDMPLEIAIVPENIPYTESWSEVAEKNSEEKIDEGIQKAFKEFEKSFQEKMRALSGNRDPREGLNVTKSEYNIALDLMDGVLDADSSYVQEDSKTYEIVDNIDFDEIRKTQEALSRFAKRAGVEAKLTDWEARERRVASVN